MNVCSDTLIFGGNEASGGLMLVLTSPKKVYQTNTEEGRLYLSRTCHGDSSSHGVPTLLSTEACIPDTHFFPSRSDMTNSFRELSSTTEDLMLSPHIRKVKLSG